MPIRGRPCPDGQASERSWEYLPTVLARQPLVGATGHPFRLKQLELAKKVLTGQPWKLSLDISRRLFLKQFIRGIPP